MSADVTYIPNNILKAVRDIGEREGIDKIILFGSRARGDFGERSDIDLAFTSRDVMQYFRFCDSLDDIETLLSFDVVDLGSDFLSRDLMDEIRRDGIVIYEKV